MINTGANKLFVWRDSVMYLGESFQPEMHNHHAVQCCIALTGNLKVRSCETEDWQHCHAAIIGANVSHSLACTGGFLCLLYLEKTSSCLDTIVGYQCNSQKCNIKKEPLLLHEPIPGQVVDILMQAISSRAENTDAASLRQACLELFNIYLSKTQVLDVRLTGVLNLLRSNLAHNYSGAELAKSSSLSESRLQHLFKQQLGIPIRKYVLWMRIRLVLKKAMSGTSLTEAAHYSGFADSAHFSRTFKSMFGIAASSLLSAKNGLQAVFCE